jgi:hypothetical protein
MKQNRATLQEKNPKEARIPTPKDGKPHNPPHDHHPPTPFNPKDTTGTSP